MAVDIHDVVVKCAPDITVKPSVTLTQSLELHSTGARRAAASCDLV
jgi:hypothetical protein